MYLCICNCVFINVFVYLLSQYMCLGNKENRPLVIFLVTFTDNTPVLDSDCSNPLFSDFCSPRVAHFTLFLRSLTPPSLSQTAHLANWIMGWLEVRHEDDHR